jgi:hypothetical protein
MSTKAFPPVAALGDAIAVALLCGWLAIGMSDNDRPSAAARGSCGFTA